MFKVVATTLALALVWTGSASPSYAINHARKAAVLAASAKTAPVVSLNFATGAYSENGTTYASLSSLPGWHFSRTGAGLAQYANGTWTSFASNIPRITNQGLLIEQASTNSVTDDMNLGMTVGMIGTTPTNNEPTGWSYSMASGVTATIAGYGTEFGLSYVDYTISGTPSASPHFSINFNLSTNIPATAGQNWTSSVFARVISGSVTANVTSVSVRHNLYNSTPSSIGQDIGPNYQSNVQATLVSGQPYRLVYNDSSVTNGTGTTAYIQPTLSFSGSGSAVSYTVRVYAPQTEQNVSFATSPILSNGSATTRGADVAYVSGLRAQAGVTLWGKVNASRATSGASNETAVSLNDNSLNNRITAFRAGPGGNGFSVRYAVGATNGLGTNPVGHAWGAGVHDVAITGPGALNSAGDGALLEGGTASTVPPFTQLTIGVGETLNSAWLNDYVRATKVFSTSQSPAALQSLTLQ